jgi:hypothetical protein
MQSLRLPRSAHPVASAAELAAGPTDLDELIQEAGETAQALSDPKQKAAVKRWLDKLRPLVVRPSLATRSPPLLGCCRSGWAAPSR